MMFHRDMLLRFELQKGLGIYELENDLNFQVDDQARRTLINRLRHSRDRETQQELINQFIQGSQLEPSSIWIVDLAKKEGGCK